MSTKEEELFDAMARDGMAAEYIKDMISARRTLFGGGSKEGCARCSAEAHAAMAAPEGGASITFPGKPTKPLWADPNDAALRKRLEELARVWETNVQTHATNRSEYHVGAADALRAALDGLHMELAK